MQGTILYSLNELKRKYPAIYTKQLAKYDGRSELMSKTVDDLGVWNDVLHLSPISPHEIMSKLKAAGAKTFPWRAFVIDANHLDWTKTRIMKTTEVNGDIVNRFLPFTEENYQNNCEITELTRRQYREMVAAGEAPFILGGSPHVLYKGEIETKGAEVIAG